MMLFGPRAKLKRILNLAAQTPACEEDRRKYYEHLEQIRSLIHSLNSKLPASALPLFKEDLIEKFGSEIVHSALHALNLIEEGDIEREMLSLAKRFGCTADALRLLAPRNPAQYFPQLDPEKRFLAFVDAVEKNRGRSLLLQYLELTPEGVNLRNDCNQSLLWYAVGSKNQELAQFLLEQNIDVHLEDVRRETIFDYCRERVTYQRCQVSQWFLENYGHQEAKTLNKPEQLQGLCRLVKLGVLSPQQVGLAGFIFGVLLSRLEDADSRAIFQSFFDTPQWPETTLIGLLRGARRCELKEVTAFARDCLNHESYNVRAEACAYLIKVQDEQGLISAEKLVESGKLKITEARKLRALSRV